jgi:DNA-binding response OmpR family regulator
MSRAKIILIEDDPAILEALAAALRDEFAVWVARDGTHALEVAEELGWDADAIVVDLRLGEGPRGDQFVDYYRTRARRRDVPVIIVSGTEGAYDVARRMGGARVLTKPVDVGVLVSTVKRLVEAGSQGGGAAAR